MLKIIDTNITLRYLIQDDYNLAVKAKEIIDEGAYTLPECIVEMVYVLSKVYKTERKEIYFAILDLLQDVEMIDKQIYINAARIFGRTKLDFVDCVLASRHKMLNDKIYTFDKKLEKELKSVEFGTTVNK